MMITKGQVNRAVVIYIIEVLCFRETQVNASDYLIEHLDARFCDVCRIISETASELNMSLSKSQVKQIAQKGKTVQQLIDAIFEAAN